MTNIIDIYFDSVGSTATAPSKLWQWSKGQVVRINGLDLPTVYQVHFSNNPTLGTAEPVVVSGNMVSIPDIYLTTGEPVYLFIWLSDETSAETIRKGTIYVAKRSQPSGEYDPTAEQQTIIDGLIGSINTAVDTAEGYADSAQTYSGNAATSATEALDAKDAAQGYAEQARQTAQGVEILVNRAEDAADDAETAKQDVEQLKQAVEGFADDAESAKTDAETARGEAQGFAQTATTKASEAVQSASQASQSTATATAQAQTATAKATEASQSAETATAKASEASASATTATAKASEASTSASTATTAKNDAVTAKNAAVTARTGAETARTGAETAAQSVSASAAQIATNTSDITDLKEDLSDLSSDGVVPTSRQLLSDKYAVDEEPYKYRASYSGDRMEDEIVGGSIVWNQLVPLLSSASTVEGVTLTHNGDGSVTISGTSTARSNIIIMPVTESNKKLIKNHVYYMKGSPSGGSNLTYYTGIAGLVIDTGNGGLFRHSYDWTSSNFRLDFLSDVTFDNVKVYPQYYDLTQMFGTEIADAVYAMEQAKAGAGVAWFKKLFPKDYYEYNAGELMSVEGVSAHEMVGFNLWDEDWKLFNNNHIGTKNPIPCLPNTEYYMTAPNHPSNGLKFYTADMVQTGTTIYNTGRFTTPNNAAYMTFEMAVAYGTTYNHDICINLSDLSRNGEYEPYVKHAYLLDGALTLRGIPKIDVSGNLYYDGDTYESDGTVTRRYGVIDLGTQSWSYDSSNACFFATAVKGNRNGTPYISTMYVDNGAVSVTQLTNLGGTLSANALYLKNTAYTDATAFKAAMSGVYLVYELATPTTETAQPYQNPQIVDASGTEEYVSTSIVPVGHYTKYYDDLRKKLDGLPWDLSMIAPIETGTTASQAYAVGKYFLLGNQLCKAKTAIASGATFTLNTNYEVTTVADELYTALHA